LAKYRRANPKKEGVDICEVQTALPQKRKELIFEKYRRANPKKEGIDICEVQTTLPQKGRS